MSGRGGRRVSENVTQPESATYRPVRAIGGLLMLQVAGLVALGAYQFYHVLSKIDWRDLGPEAPPDPVIEALAVFLFAPPAVMMFVAALGFLFMRRRGWILAAISQGLSLVICLWLYTELQPVYVYPIMAYCVFVILYLNSQDVRTVFHVRREAAQQRFGSAA
jgi:hypothetical protein